MAMKLGAGGGSFTDINMTPLIDVMLVILIMDRKTMQGYITEQDGEDPQPEVHVSVNKFAKYAKVAETLADLQSRGLKKIGFINNELF